MKRSLDPAASALILALGALVYWQGIYGGFIFDDFPNLVVDPDWKVTALDPMQWRRAMAMGIASDFGRPLAMLSFAINHYFTALDPYWLKLTNLGFHLLNGVLVFIVCRQLLSSAEQGIPRQSGAITALFIALAWTLHPMQVSSALYVVQRMELGAHTGVLLALIFYFKARSNQQIAKGAAPWFALSLLATLFGLGFKESAALVPGYALALELTIFRFRTTGTRASRWLLGCYAAGFVAALAAYLFYFLPIYFAADAYAFRPFTVTERLIAQVHALTMYLGQILLPLPDKLLFYYDNFPYHHSVTNTLAKLALLAGLLVSALLFRRRWPIFSLGVLWFFVGHALTSNVVPLELAFEHRNYFALLGILLCLAQVLSGLLAKCTPGTRGVVAVALVAFLAFLTAIQSSTWGDPLRLAVSLASKNPTSPRASYDLGLQLLRTADSDPTSPLLSLAVKELEHASNLPGASPLPEQALIFIHSRQKKDVDPDTWDRFRRKLEERPAGPQEAAALQGVLECRLAGNCPLDDQELLDTFLVALQANPDSPIILLNYANFAFYVLGDVELGLRVMRECVRLDPFEIIYKINLARMLTTADPSSEELPQLLDQIRAEDKYGRFGEETADGLRFPAAKQN